MLRMQGQPWACPRQEFESRWFNAASKEHNKKHGTSPCIFVGWLEWTRTTDPHLIRVVL